jgi:hypothetical protein
MRLHPKQEARMRVLAVALLDWTDDPWVGHAANVAQLIAVTLAIPAAFWAYRQLKAGTASSESQAILALDEALYRHDELRKELNSARGYEPEANDPNDVKLRRYLAVFERLGLLLRKRVVRDQLADQLYGSRLEKLLTKNNGHLQPILTERGGKGWENFLWLRRRLADKMDHRTLPDPTQGGAKYGSDTA